MQVNVILYNFFFRKLLTQDFNNELNEVCVHKSGFPDISVASPSNSSVELTPVESAEDNTHLNTGYWADVAQDMVNGDDVSSVGSPPPSPPPQRPIPQTSVDRDIHEQQGRLINELKLSLKKKTINNDDIQQRRTTLFNKIVEDDEGMLKQNENTAALTEYQNVEKQHLKIDETSHFETSTEYENTTNNTLERYTDHSDSLALEYKSPREQDNNKSVSYEDIYRNVDVSSMQHIYQSVDDIQRFVKAEIEKGAADYVPEDEYGNILLDFMYLIFKMFKF